MTSRNQNRPPQNHSNVSHLSNSYFYFIDCWFDQWIERMWLISYDFWIKVGSEEIERQRVSSRAKARAPLTAMVNNATASSVEGTDSTAIEFTKDDIEALLNEKMKKGTPFDNKVSLILLIFFRAHLDWLIWICLLS